MVQAAMKGRPRRTLLAGLACIAIAAVVPSIILVQHAPTTPKAVLASSAGTPDGSFGGTGVVIQPGSNGATGVAVIPAGLPFAGDSVVSAGDGSHFQVARFTSGGGLDTSFGSGVTNAFAGQALGIAVVPPGATNAGDVVAVGYETGTICGGAQFPIPVVAEYLPNGSLNGAFNGTGMATLPCPVQGGELKGVAVDSTGKIYAAGVAFGSANAQSTLVANLTSSGGLLWSLASIVGNQVAGHSPTAVRGQRSGVLGRGRPDRSRLEPGE